MPCRRTTALLPEILHFLMEHCGKSAADLPPVFGEISHVGKVLNGKRSIEADQARMPGRLFCVKPGILV